MIRRPPRSTPLYSSAASDVYKRQFIHFHTIKFSSSQIFSSFFFINDYFKSFTNFFFIFLKRNFLLYFHYFLCSLFFYFTRYIIVKEMSCSIFFMRVSEDSYPVKFNFLQKGF